MAAGEDGPPRIIRLWASEGDNWEIPIPEDIYTGMLPALDSPEWAEMTRNYLRSRYGVPGGWH